MLILASSDLALQPAASEAEFQQIAGLPGDDNRRPVAAAPGDRSCLVTKGKEGGKATIRIQSRILLYNADPAHISAQVFEAFRRYIAYAIESTWNSSSNSLMSPTRKVFCDVTAAKRLTNTGTLQAGELFIAVKKSEGRSFIRGDRRSGIFYIDAKLHDDLNDVYKDFIAVKEPNQNNIKDALLKYDDYTVAHEFGHVLGLADRYALVCYYLPPAPQKGKKPELPPEIITDRAHTVPLYLSESYDGEYATDYRWLFNLMSTRREPVEPGSTIIWDHDDIRSKHVIVQKTKRYAQLYKNVSKTKSAFIHITAKQLQLIEDKLVESLPGSNHIYFKILDRSQYGKTNYSLEYTFRGTYVGIADEAGGKVGVANDDRYDFDRNSGDSKNDPSVEPMSVDAKMDRRCFQISSTWVEGDALVRPTGFLQAALDIRSIGDPYGPTKIVDGAVVPQQLLKLIDLEHLDRAVAIRRLVSEWVQRSLNPAGDLVIKRGADVLRNIKFSSLMEIRAIDAGFTPKTDLFAKDEDLFAGGPADKAGVFVPYNYGKYKFRAGKTLFYQGTEPTDPGITHKIKDPEPILATDQSRIKGSDSAARSVVAQLWNAAFQAPDRKLFFLGDTILPYSAGIYQNRTRLIYLHVHGKLTNTGDSNPGNVTLDRCFKMKLAQYSGSNMRISATGAGVDNTNPKGSYIGFNYNE